jgi:hypothetical protein
VTITHAPTRNYLLHETVYHWLAKWTKRGLWGRVLTAVVALTSVACQDNPRSPATGTFVHLPDAEPTVFSVDPCQTAVQAVRDEIASINYCTRDSDCAVIRGRCPFGCYFLHNRSESLAPLESLIDEAYEEQQCKPCMYKCASQPPLACVGKICSFRERTAAEEAEENRRRDEVRRRFRNLFSGRDNLSVPRVQKESNWLQRGGP